MNDQWQNASTTLFKTNKIEEDNPDLLKSEEYKDYKLLLEAEVGGLFDLLSGEE